MLVRILWIKYIIIIKAQLLDIYIYIFFRPMLHTSRFSQYSITPISGTKDSFSSKVEMSPAGFQFRQDCVFEQEAGERWTAAHCRTSLHVIDCGYRTVWTSVLEEADNLAFATALSFSWLHYTLTQSPIFHLSLHWYSNKSGYWLVLVLHHQASKITATSCLHESVKKKWLCDQNSRPKSRNQFVPRAPCPWAKSLGRE